MIKVFINQRMVALSVDFCIRCYVCFRINIFELSARGHITNCCQRCLSSFRTIRQHLACLFLSDICGCFRKKYCEIVSSIRINIYIMLTFLFLSSMNTTKITYYPNWNAEFSKYIQNFFLNVISLLVIGCHITLQLTFL